MVHHKLKIMKKLLFVFFTILAGVVFAQTKFQHISNQSKGNSNSTFLDAAGLNKNPNAIIIVEADANARAANPHAIGVWYDGNNWAVFNQDKAIMPAGITFSISWKNPDANAFYQRSSAANLVNGRMMIDNAALNNNPAAAFYVSQVWNPGGGNGVYNNADIDLEYDKAAAKWLVRNASGTPIPEGAAFNIMINSDVKKAPAVFIPIRVDINASAVANAALINQANLGFEHPFAGNWVATGNAFSNQPVEGNTVMSERVLTNMAYGSGGIGGDYWKGMLYPIGFKGNNWIGTYEKGNGDAATGTLTSKPFAIVDRYLTFLLGGGKDLNKLFVELQVKKSDYEAAWGAGKHGLWGDTEDGFTRVDRVPSLLNSEELFRYYFDMDAELNHQFHGKTIRIRIVDDKTTSWGHINVDDFLFAPDLNDYLSLNKAGFGLLADPDVPVWGFFDSHAHPTANEAFGKNLYIGNPIAPMSDCFSTENCIRSHSIAGHDPHYGDDPNNNDALTANLSPHRMVGWPELVAFPRFDNVIHQKYHVEFIKRAWQGGLRLLCALAVNNMFIASRALGHYTNGQAIDDESVMYRSLDMVKEMARQNSEWMEIATSSRQARRIIKEGKLAVVLGVEADVFGNFKSPDCTWGDRGEDHPLVTITNDNAETLLENKLNEYFNYGVRQVLPLHYLSKPFGGTAVFNGITFLAQIASYDHVNVKGGISRGAAFNLYEDFSAGAALTALFTTFPAYAARIHKQNEESEINMVNADGLTTIGQRLFTKLMDKHFIIDQEHGSYESKDAIFAIASSKNNYPVIASHVDPLGLAFKWRNAPVRWAGEYFPASGIVNLNRNSDNINNFGTTNIRNLSHEMELSDDNYSHIRQSDGTIGVFTTLNRKQTYHGSFGTVEDNCAGSSKTFAQMYLYSLDKMNGRGVGLATDMPMVSALCPRFGAFASWALKSENDDIFKITQRTTERRAQHSGVFYDVKSRTYHHELFEGSDIPGWEQDVFKALAAWDASASPFENESSISISGEPGHPDRIRSYARGLFADNFNQLRTCCGDTPFEEGAMFLLKSNATDLYNALPDGFWRNHLTDVTRVYNQLKPVFDTWISKSFNNWTDKTPNNEPLRRYITGNRYWDYNLDGLAHFGLVPDMLQDLKNIGLSTVQLNPLFKSVEDYLKMWEKAER